MKIPRLMLITDGTLETNPCILHKLFSACQGGLPAIQLREKTLEARRLWEAANRLRKITSEKGIFFSINDRIDVALSVNADAVHLPEAGLSPQIPKKLKPSLIVGASVHSIEMGRRAEEEGADYVLFGPIFSTPSKVAFGKPLGLKHLEKAAQTLSIPVLAVGGITAAQTRPCINAGAYGVAAIQAFMQSKHIESTVNDFLRELTDY